ncbi:hypothetical protein K7432_016477 [Basidiobolus ranarum]|uniref:Uncharacterized protein n=1 Tax=Basidiobolus ranarum TaxID=34480 RepID=A0ABR2WEN1_9FUNG
MSLPDLPALQMSYLEQRVSLLETENSMLKAQIQILFKTLSDLQLSCSPLSLANSSPQTASPTSIPVPLSTQKTQNSQEPCHVSSQSYSQVLQTQPSTTSKRTRAPSQQVSSKPQRRFPITSDTPPAANWTVCYFTNADYLPISEQRKYLKELGIYMPRIINLQYISRNILEVILDKDIADLFIEEVKEYLEWEHFDHTFRQHIDSPLFAPFSLEKELLARFTSLLKNSPSIQVTNFLRNYYSEQAVELHSPLSFDIQHLWEIANSKVFN